jgi:uncharacterized membrane protein
MESTMNRIATSLLTAGLLLAGAPAKAELTVTPSVMVTNHCSREIVIAVRYKDVRGSWTTTDFTSIRARGTTERVASTDNRIIYIYAETVPRHTKWSGDHNVRVAGKTYPMQELRLDKRNNTYGVNLRC